MSDIAKKTLPADAQQPTSAKTADTTSQPDPSAPRSAKAGEEGASNVTDSESYSPEAGSEYTHEKQGGGEQLEGIEEESRKIQMKDDEEGDEKPSSDDFEKLEGEGDDARTELEAQSREQPDFDADDDETEETQSKDQTRGDEAASAIPATEDGNKTEEQPAPSESEATGKTSLLTEQAKEALDRASEDQPTDEARESFLQSAKSGLTAGSTMTGATKETGETATSEAQSQSQEQTSQPQASHPGDEDTATETRTAPSEYTATESQAPKTGASQAGTSRPSDGVSGEQQYARSVTFDESQNKSQEAPTEYTGDESGSATGTEQTATQTGTGYTQSQTGTQSQTQPSHPSDEISGTDQYPQTGTGTTTYDYGAPTVTQADQTGTGTTTYDYGAPTATQAGQTGATGESVTVAEDLDFSVLKNGRVNKGGNVVDSDGKVVGRVVSGILQYLVGKKVDENGDIWADNGKVIGKAEPISESEREDMLKEAGPFESFPDAVVDGNGMVVSNGEWVGKVIEGDLKVLRGKSVDADGDIMDKSGNVIGRAERWEPEPEQEPEPEPEVDRSILAGKRVNKAGNVVDNAGVIYGRVVEGDVQKMVGRMCDKNGNILSESGDILGRAELVSEGEREGMKEGPFSELKGCTVAKDGTIVTPGGDIVGRLVQGDAKQLFGRPVDDDGDVIDKNGNVIGHAERWTPEEVERKKNPMTGRRVNREGNVVDEDGNIIGKLTSGDPQACSGKEIDDDGDVIDNKGTVIGHCTLLEDIRAEESPEEKEKREQVEKDKKLALQMAVCIEQCLDKIRPICKMITEKIDKAERTPEDERDEEALVKEVKPLIEEGGRILTEAKGIIKGLDPDGRIAANAKHKTAAREATPEEYHLAEVLKDLTGDVTQCIENARKKLEDMPHAKKELNPLWGLLNEPLFQILAAVGLLLAGVLNLVGRLLGGLGLGGLVDGLLGTLGLNRVLQGLGLGAVTKSLTGGGKKKSGGLLGLGG
ncbi:hypothetical protein QBC32DRAFT_333590 [Pseudoneurospora amorphoporcata]|uniref:DUF6987 domain-containing protein n=1 Tax=Pseudoneurospora amorphoporcata TaxID=241081 RepID=A0AAN6P0H5_9PEZI|nr:hypothetical protein QBC32DRAFT_333590 [Pseudoneurospora amorphoporcata]